MPTISITLNTAWNIRNFRSGLIRALLHEGYQVLAIAPPDEEVKAIEALGARFIPLRRLSRKGTNPVQDLRLAQELYHIYRREGVDVALHYTIKPVIYGSFAARLAGVRCVNTITGLGYAFLSDGLVNKAVQRLYRLALRRADLTLLQNQDDYNLFVESGLSKAERTAVVHGSGIDTAHFSPVDMPSDPKHFLFIGRLLYDKGIVEFAEAASIVKQQHPDASFHVLGALDKGNPAAINPGVLQSWIDDDIIHYHGTVADTRPYIARCTAVVLPSYREGLPRVMLEGMSMAKPLITTDVPGCRETVDHLNNGYLVKVKDALDLAAAMLRLLTLTPGEQASMGQSGRQLALRRFSEETIISTYLKSIRQLI